LVQNVSGKILVFSTRPVEEAMDAGALNNTFIIGEQTESIGMSTEHPLF
jgi:hypothetical protein